MVSTPLSAVGVRRVSEDIREMLGHPPGLYWQVCWVAIAPVFLFFIIIFAFATYKPLELDGYKV